MNKNETHDLLCKMFSPNRENNLHTLYQSNGWGHGKTPLSKYWGRCFGPSTHFQNEQDDIVLLLNEVIGGMDD